MSDIALEIVKLSKSYTASGHNTKALQDVSFQVPRGNFLTIVGPSGCGKTTLLRIVAGLEEQFEGTALCMGKNISGPSVERALVFQDKALFYWKTIEGNIEFPLLMRGMKKERVRKETERLMKVIGLMPFAKKYPHQLSGGQQQLAAIARCLAADPKILLMDEPFGSLDYQTRTNLQWQLEQLWQTDKRTVLFVTHDIEEAIYLGSQVLVMSSDGRIIELLSMSGIPKDGVEVRTQPAFVEMKQKIWQMLMN